MSPDAPCGGVLVVDDDPDIRDSLREVLEDEGYEVSCVGNGREALDHLRAASPRPCVILLDLMMPVMDGRTFRAEQHHCGVAVDVPLVILSAARDASEQAEQLGAATVIHKPFEITTVLDLATRILDPPAP
jgi:CheY-like chemotaxis protein